jgi:pimeloyl-ACP methyl ester carboxylesterase
VRGRRTRGTGILVVVLVCIIPLLSACGRGQQQHDAALARSTAVSFDSADGVHLEGRLFGRGNSTGVVLSHMLPADQSSWWDFAQILADSGYLALTFDFRGYCPGGNAGCSKGERDISGIWQDVLGAVDFIRSQGADSVSLVGASMGGTASLVAAAHASTPIAAVITLSAPTSIEGLVADPNVLTLLSGGKLFIAGVGDASAATSAEQLYEQSPPPKRVEIVPADDHGTDLLTGSQSEEVRTLVFNYIAQFGGTA